MARFSFEKIKEELIHDPVSSRLEVVICIPCYYESNLSATIDSLLDCHPITGITEIIILINEPANCDDSISSSNLNTYQYCVQKLGTIENDNVRLYPVYVNDIPTKKAGVGLARKLAMDEAAQRLLSIKNDRGVIVCLDADTTVKSDYLKEIMNFFLTESDYEACSISFAHYLEGDDVEINYAICQYELHLRYFINMQRLINLPFAFQTVGSAMAVTANAYKKLGGMNTRKAGEDFYFLHKFIKNGLVKDLNTTCVYPSSRVSDRVPFGTGKAVGNLLQLERDYETYNPASFRCIQSLVMQLPKIYNETPVFSDLSLDSNLEEYLTQHNFVSKIAEIKKHTKSFASFVKRFYDWFDAFRLMKCLHHLRDNGYPDVPISDAVKVLFEDLKLDWVNDDKFQNLIALREFDMKE